MCAWGGGGVRNRRRTETCCVLTHCIRTCAGHTPAYVTYSAVRRNPRVHGDLICAPSLRSHAFVPSYFFFFSTALLIMSLALRLMLKLIVVLAAGS